MKKIKAKSGYILQEDTKRVVIATMKSSNVKTGDMVQVTVLHKDIDPVTLKANKQDSIICGSCPLKSGNGCYVNVGQAPLAIFKAYKAGKYSNDVNEFLEVVKTKKVRFGAYGDPSFINIDLLKQIANNSLGYTGYTHQWMNRSFNLEYLDYLQASIDNVNQLKLLKAKAPKAKYFRIVRNYSEILENETICHNETKGIECRDCLECNGTTSNFVILAHGTQKNKVITL